MRIEIILSYQIHHYADERQIAPIVEKMKRDWRMADNRQCDDGKRGVNSLLQASVFEGDGSRGRAAEIRVTLGLNSWGTGYGHDKSDRYDHGD